jgi:hypothetical protein
MADKPFASLAREFSVLSFFTLSLVAGHGWWHQRLREARLAPIHMRQRYRPLGAGGTPHLGCLRGMLREYWLAGGRHIHGLPIGEIVIGR